MNKKLSFCCILLTGALSFCCAAAPALAEGQEDLNGWRLWDEEGTGTKSTFDDSLAQKIAEWQGRILGGTADAGIAVETETEAAAETSDYIFPDTDTRCLTADEVQRLSLQGACYAKNEIYARHGRKFLSRELSDYFGEKSWYQGTVEPENFSSDVFNSYELANIELLTEWEHTLDPNGYTLDQAGYDIHSF